VSFVYIFQSSILLCQIFYLLHLNIYSPQKTQVPLNVSSSSKAQKTTYDLSNSHSKEIQHNSEITSDMSKIPGSDSDRSCPSTGNSTNTSQRLQQKKEQIAAARKARLEEMRDKVSVKF